MNLDPALLHALSAAQGFLDLGLPKEALKELSALGERYAEQNELLQMRMTIHIRLKQWKLALELAQMLCTRLQDDPHPFLDAAFCLHEMGRTADAKAVLIGGPSSLAKVPVFFYNMACYEAQLGNVGVARDLLDLAIDQDADLKILAKTDPDLAPLRVAA
jgi:predicted Zn-dependent protease